MKPLGSDGRPIPTPPDPRAGREILADRVRQGLWLIAWPIGFLGLLMVLRQEPFSRFTWNPMAQKLALVASVIAAAVPAFMLLGAMLNYVSWPFRRKDAGQHYERRIGRLSPEQVADQIAIAHEVLGYLKDPRKRRDWERWLAWLERQSNVPPQARTGLAPGLYRPPLSVRVWAGIWATVVWIIGGFMVLDSPDWARGLLFGFVALIFTGGFVSNLTERLELTTDSLTHHAFGRRRWSAPREHIATREDGVGSSTYELYDTRTGRMLGQIEGSTFGVETVEALADLFPPWLREEAN